MIYLSLVGTQIMAVLNPFLGLIKANKKPKGIQLFHTFRTSDVANTIKKYLIDGGHYLEFPLRSMLIARGILLLKKR